MSDDVDIDKWPPLEQLQRNHDRTERIRAIKRILQSGATTVSVDGLNVSIDREDLRRQLRELEEVRYPGTRPRIATLNLRNV